MRTASTFYGCSIVTGIAIWLLSLNTQAEITYVEDFESYAVSDSEYLDPTTVANSRWVRDDLGNGADWEVACCSGTGNIPNDDTFDESDQHLRMRRANDASILATQLLTDMKLVPMKEGSVSFELNPSSTGLTAFHGGLFDSATGNYKMQIKYREFGANNGNFIVYGTSVGGYLAAGTNPKGYPASFDRWFRVTINTYSNSTFDVFIDDIGPTTPTSISGEEARGNILSLVGASNDVSVVNRLRLAPGAGNGGSNDHQPTMIDNVIQSVVIEAPVAPVEGTETLAARKVTYTAQDGVEYQAQFTDGVNILADDWTDLGSVVEGDGGAAHFYAALADNPNRMFRVIEIVPPSPLPVVEDFEYTSVAMGDYPDVSTLSTNWTRDGVDEPDWVVACCNGDFEASEDTFDGSDRLMSLDRANDFLPSFSDENTDFNLAAVVGGALSNHTVSVEVNPSGVGGGNGFHMALYDSSTSNNAVRIGFRETTNNSGNFEVFDGNDVLLATGNGPAYPPGAFERWFKVLVTIWGDGTMDVFCDDIGPTSDASGTPPEGPRGNQVTIQGQPLENGVTSVDTFRLLPGQSNGGSVNYRPTTIDNIAVGPPATSTGVPIGPINWQDAVEIVFPSVADKQYQPQYSDDGGTLWIDLDGQINGTGGTNSLFDDQVPGRTWRVLDLQP